MSLVIGLILGVGILLTASALRPRGLAVAISSYSMKPGVRISSGDRIVRLASKFFAPAISDLAVLDRTMESFALERLVCSALGAMVPILCGLLIGWSGGGIPMSLVVLAVPLTSTGGAYLPLVTTRRSARTARRDFRTSFSAYLDLVSIMLAGGAGAETALIAAARVGSGRTFTVITRCLDVARSTRRSAWEVLAEEGDRLGIVELPELAATIQLSGEQGARMTSSLVAKARSMRSKQMAEIEAAANSSTERMGLPMVLMFMGFLVLLGYPAMHLIGQGFS